MSHSAKEEELKRKAQLAFRAETVARQQRRVFTEAERRHADMLAKTSRLREQRLAKEAMQQDTDAAKASGVRPRKKPIE